MNTGRRRTAATNDLGRRAEMVFHPWFREGIIAEEEDVIYFNIFEFVLPCGKCVDQDKRGCGVPAYEDLVPTLHERNRFFWR